MSQKKNSKRNGVQPGSPAPPSTSLIVVAGIVLVGAALLLLFGSLGGQTATAPGVTPQVSGRPSLNADNERVDLGDVKLGQTVNVSFLLTNVGDQPLQFTGKPYIQVAAGC